MSEPDPALWLEGVAENFSDRPAEESVWGRSIIENILFAFDYCFTLLEGAYKDISYDEELEEKLLPLFDVDKNIIEAAYNSFKSCDWNGKYKALECARSGFSGNKFPRLSKGYSDAPAKHAAKAKRDAYKSVFDDMLDLMCCTEEENSEDIRVLAPVASELIVSVKEYNEMLLEMKKEMSAFSFSDISHFALSLLCDNTAPDGKTPLARELSEFYSEILIDEYQDTNRAQDTLFRTVSKDGLNMFFVGDVKQSIYRFRLASPEIFIEKCNRFPYYDGTQKESKIILSENFRSRKGILDGVNYVFSSLMSPECGEIEYSDDEKLNFPSVFTPEDTVDVHYTVLEAGEDKEYLREAKYIASVIKEKLTDGFVEDKGVMRRPEPSDFCILLRSKAGVLQYFVNELKRAGLPVSADAVDSFFDSAEIMTIVSYLRSIDNPTRDTDLLSVMLSPLFGFTPDDVSLLRLKYGRRTSLYAAVLRATNDGDEKCRQLSESLDRYKRLAACRSVDSLIREIYTDTAYIYVAGALSDGERRKKNLLKLLETAEKNSEVYTTLGSFIKFLELMRENDSDIGEAGVGGGVRVMTMHRSKGLEFPFVFIAGTTKGFNKTDTNASLVISHERGLGIKRKEPENLKLYHTLSSKAVKTVTDSYAVSEELRICYVALTRAKQELFIVSAFQNAAGIIEKTEYLLSNIDSIPPYLVRHSTNSAKWFLFSFINHPDAEKLRCVFPVKTKGQGRLDIRFEDKLSEDKNEEPKEEKAEPDTDTVNEIKERASFVYGYNEVASALSKHTASSLRDEHFDASGFAKSVPAFMFSTALSPTDIGTATHKFLQYCDFSRCFTCIDDEKQRLVDAGRLTRKQADAVDASAISAFVSSDLMKRINLSEKVFREKQFTILKSVCDIDSNIPEKFRDEKTVVIGKIDLLFVEHGAAVLVDYKTENIDDIKILADRYRSQMLLYVEAVEKAMGLRVTECILYSLKLKDSISISS